MKRSNKILMVLAIIVACTLWAYTPAKLVHVPVTSADLSLQSVLYEPQDGLIPGTEKRVLWFDGDRRTEWSVVALHGFSASRQETAPLAELVAERIGANLFETRFSGHGKIDKALVGVTAEEWLDDVAEALAAGAILGEKVVVLGVSNGGTLATAMLDHPLMEAVDSLILISPNFSPHDPNTKWITRPGGELLLKVLAGDTHSWEAYNEPQGLFWTTSYPTAALVEVMRVVNRANIQVRKRLPQRVQIFYSADDTVISVDALLSAFDAVDSPRKEIVEVHTSDAASSHIFIGDIMLPENTLPAVEQISEFILRPIS